MPELAMLSVATTTRYSLTCMETCRSLDKEPGDNNMGTFDVTILTVDDGIFEVKSTTGNSHLG